MPRFAEYFATVSNGKIVGLTVAHPPHELLPNQVMLTEREYKLLYVVQSVEEARKLLSSVEYKIGELKNAP